MNQEKIGNVCATLWIAALRGLGPPVTPGLPNVPARVLSLL